jgi:anti-sigma B factor antagonist
MVDDVVVIRCHGRIVAGAEVAALQAELDKQTVFVKMVVLHLAGVDYVDSSGLGALVRALGVLRAAGGSLKLCQASPFVVQVLRVTKLLSILPSYPSETEAIEAFYERSSREAIESSSGTNIICVDTSKDLLAYLRALLTSAGYKVHTAWNLMDAKSLVGAIKPQLVICGAGMQGLPTAAAAIESFRQSAPKARILELPPDFSAADAGKAGQDLVERVQSTLTP